MEKFLEELKKKQMEKPKINVREILTMEYVFIKYKTKQTLNIIILQTPDSTFFQSHCQPN